jgi:hypothetical protein
VKCPPRPDVGYDGLEVGGREPPLHFDLLSVSAASTSLF